MNIPSLSRVKRAREYNSYSDRLRDKVVYEYIFKGMAHRWIDENILGLDADYSRGYQSMGILHYLGLKSDFKGIFKDLAEFKVIELLKNKDEKLYKNIIDCIIRYTNNLYSEYDLSMFIPRENSKVLNKQVGTSQYTDGVRIKKELKDEFKRVFPKPIGEFTIQAGKDVNHFTFNHKVEAVDLDDTEDAEEYPEGKRAYKTHLIIERNQKVIKAAKDNFMRKHNGRLFCETCGFDFTKVYGERGEGFIEGHHKKLVSEMKEGEKTKVEDIIMLCSNCHRMVHRKPLLSVGELKELIVKEEQYYVDRK